MLQDPSRRPPARHQSRPPATEEEWTAALERAKRIADRRTHGAAPAPYRALEGDRIVQNHRARRRLTAEPQTLADLIESQKFWASVYSFDLSRSGVEGPSACRISCSPATGGRSGWDHGEAGVFGELEKIHHPTAILASNTSSLSITEIAQGLQHPERVVGYHLFNPVDVMPLLEIVPGERTDDHAALATAFALAQRLKKAAIPVQDETGFVVNRPLLRSMGDVLAAIDEGTPIEIVDKRWPQSACP